jgi:hypothetical protein
MKDICEIQTILYTTNQGAPTSPTLPEVIAAVGLPLIYDLFSGKL